MTYLEYKAVIREERKGKDELTLALQLDSMKIWCLRSTGKVEKEDDFSLHTYCAVCIVLDSPLHFSLGLT